MDMLQKAYENYSKEKIKEFQEDFLEREKKHNIDRKNEIENCNCMCKNDCKKIKKCVVKNPELHYIIKDD